MRYLNQLLRDISEIRLRRCGVIAAEQMLHAREHGLGYRCSFDGAAGANGPALFAQGLAEAREVKENKPAPDEAAEMERDVESFMRGPDEAMPTLAARIGIDLDALPPADVLTDEQLTSITTELMPTLALHGATYGGPHDYPPRLTFARVLELARSQRPIYTNGGFVDDGCTGYSVGCTWGAYCRA